MLNIVNILSDAVKLQASDVFIQAGSPIQIKAIGTVKLLYENDNLSDEDCLSLINEMYAMNKRTAPSFENCVDDDFSLELSDISRFRVNIYRNRDGLGSVIRTIKTKIPDYRSLNIPEEVMNLYEIRSGLILVAGIAGTGKSTTLACLVDKINHTRTGHILTVEDPVEFVHKRDKCLVTQREVGVDTPDFQTALRAALRQTPDVILVGEMRDTETIQAAITAAETGHLVLATIHSHGAINAVDRIIDSFDKGQQAQIRMQLSMGLSAIVSQKLIQGANRFNGGIVYPIFEVAIPSLAFRSQIREGKTHMLQTIIDTGQDKGMLSFDTSLLRLYREGKINRDAVKDNSLNPDFIEQKLRTIC